MVPQLSALSLALCPEALEDLETIWSQKETSPLAHFARNSLPHKKLPLLFPNAKQLEAIRRVGSLSKRL